MKKILIVDDTKNIRLLLGKSLELEGHAVQTASDGKQALLMLQENSFDLVFLDIKLPEVRGTEVLRRMRGMGITTPVIIITAYATVRNAVECTKMGAVAYLQKPFTADKINAVMLELQRMVPSVPDTGTSGLMDAGAAGSMDAAQTLLAAGEGGRALEVLKSALAKDAENPEIYRAIGLAYEAMGESAKAERFFNACKALGG